MKQLILKPEKPFSYYVDVKVVDVINNNERQRFKITIDFTEDDINNLKKEGLDFNGVIKHYNDYIYDIVKLNLGTKDIEFTDGLEETLKLIERKIEKYFK